MAFLVCGWGGGLKGHTDLNQITATPTPFPLYSHPKPSHYNPSFVNPSDHGVCSVNLDSVFADLRFENLGRQLYAVPLLITNYEDPDGNKINEGQQHRNRVVSLSLATLSNKATSLCHYYYQCI